MLFRVSNFLVMSVIPFWAACAMEPATSTRTLELGESTLDRPGPADDAPVAQPSGARAPVPGGKQVGFYDMTFGTGQQYQLTPIVAAGGIALGLGDVDAASLAGLNVLWVNNQDNFGYGAEYVSRLPAIAAAVQNGMVLVIHDRFVTNASTILPGGANFGIFRDFTEQADINIRDASTVVTTGLDNASLDQGTSSSHGFALANTLPASAKLILSATTADHIVTFCYPVGKGAVIYSTIPLDFYLQGFGTNPPQAAMDNIYAPNVVKYALGGACAGALTGPKPTPNARIDRR